jgi:glutathione peroxidase-family protein
MQMNGEKKEKSCKKSIRWNAKLFVAAAEDNVVKSFYDYWFSTWFVQTENPIIIKLNLLFEL